MAEYRWNPVKSARLKKVRGVSFEELMKRGRLIDVKRHPSRPPQELLLFEYQEYVWVVPFVTSTDERFLKTLYRSRKYTKLLREGRL